MINIRSYFYSTVLQKIIPSLILIFTPLILNGIVSAQLSLDTSFNAGVSDAPASVDTSAIQQDGKILIGGNFGFANGIERSNLVRLNADGTLDTSFNTGGRGPNGNVYEIIILPDSKLLIGGSFTTYNGVGKARLARLNSDGSLDTTFNQGGTGIVGTAHTISLQADGKILVSGSISSYNGTTRFSVFRVNSDGTLDSSFTSSFTSATFVEEVDVQTDGKILIGGSFNTYGEVTRRGVARLNPDGTLDTSFNPENIQRSVVALTLQSDGKILIGGGFNDNEGNERPLIARLNADGSTDASFTVPTLTGFAAEYFAIQPDGKILAAGGFGVNNLTEVPLLRLNANGTLDNTFTLQTADIYSYHVRFQADGKILLTGRFTRYGNSNRNGIVRLNSNGGIDNSFNVSITSYGVVNAIVQQSDGKILVAGNFRTANGSAYTNLARFNIDGTLDISFNIGAGTGNDNNSANIVSTIAVQADGKILVGGRFGSFNGSPAQGIIRLNTNGLVDTSFNVTGLAASSFIIINDIHVQSDGKILVGVSGFVSLSNSFQPVYLFRLNSNGNVESTFNSGNVGPNSTVNKIVRRTDGKFIIGGAFTNYNGTSRNRVALINSDGTLDTSFNPGTGANSTVLDIALQPEGKVLIGGIFISFNGVTRNRIARLSSEGALDTSFDPGTGANNAVNSIALQSDGKIFIGGQFSTYNGTAQNRLARLNPNGSIDTMFVSGLSDNLIFLLRKILFQTDGKLLIGGVFNSYNGVPRSSLARLSTTILSRTFFDFDGDGKTDISIFRPSFGEWWYQKSSNGGNGAFQFGSTSDKMTPADYTGDGKSDFAFWRPSSGEWFVLRSEDFSFYSFPFGSTGDIPVPADYDGDGKSDAAVFRPSTLTWYVMRSSGGITIQTFGSNGDMPTVADYDGDNKADIAIYRAALGEWWIQRSSGGTIAFQFGESTDKPVQGDYTGDGKADVAFFRPSSGEWFILRSENSSYYSYPFGMTGDVPSPGDYDGDGKTDAAVYRPSNNTWYVQRSVAGTMIQTFGQSGDLSVPNSFVP